LEEKIRMTKKRRVIINKMKKENVLEKIEESAE